MAANGLTAHNTYPYTEPARLSNLSFYITTSTGREFCTALLKNAGVISVNSDETGRDIVNSAS